jgi:hypothetical protein
LLLNGIEDNESIVYLQNLNATGLTDGGTLYLFRDDNNVDSENGQDVVLGAGYYEYKANVTGNENYTDSIGKVLYVNVSKADPSGNLQIVITPSQSVTYGTDTSATASETNTGDSDLVYNLFRNGVGVSNPNLMFSPNAGNYTYVFNTTGGQNYTAGSVNMVLTVNKANSEVKLYVNHSESNVSITTADSIWLNATLVTGDSGDLYIYKNGTLVKQGLPDISNLTSFENPGIYNITAYYEGSSNYLEDWSLTWWVNVTDASPPVINIFFPEQKTYGYNTSLPLNYSAEDPNLESCWYNLNNGTNITLPGCQNTTFNASDGNYILYLYANDSQGYTGFSTRSFSVNTQISVNLVNPLDGGWVSSNNVVFNYTVVSAAVIYNCSLYGDWGGWHLNQSNSSLVNSSGGINNFSLVLGDGSYIWNVYCNGVYSDFAFTNYSLNIDAQNPVLNIQYPTDGSVFLRNVSLPLNFSVTENNLNGCWYSLDNGQTNISLNCSNGTNVLDFSYLNGTYNLTVYAEDLALNTGSDTVYNITLGYDGIAPNLSISEPVGTKNTRNNIPLTFSVVDNVDMQEELICWYNVTYVSTGGLVSGLENVSIVNCTSTSFNVPDDGDFILSLSVKDVTGNEIVKNTSFKVSTTTEPPGNGGGGGGGGYVPPLQPGKPLISGIGNIIAKPGERKTLSANIRNIGESFLNNCKLIFLGSMESWFTSTQTQGIAPGENIDFVLDLQIPEETGFGDYEFELQAKCDENNISQKLNVSIPENLQQITINELTQEKIGLIINYTFKRFSEQTAMVEIWLKDEDGIEIKRAKDSFQVEQDFTERNIVMELPEDLTGIFDLNLALANDLENPVKKTIVLGKTRTTGQVIAGAFRGKIIGYLVFAAFVGVMGFFITRSFVRRKAKRKASGEKKDSKEKKSSKVKSSEKTKKDSRVKDSKKTRDSEEEEEESETEDSEPAPRPSRTPRPPPPPPQPYSFSLPIKMREI